jgi:hypothetical protein
MKNLREKNLKVLKENHVYYENMEHDDWLFLQRDENQER